MASKEELDLDVEEKPAGKKHLLLYVVIGVLVLVLILGGVSAVLLLKKAGSTGGTGTPAEQ